MAAPTTPPRSDPEYVLGTNIEEAARLALQHRLWSASAHAAWEHAGIAPGMTVLDIGSGPGNAAVDMAEIVGARGRVICVEESPRYLKLLNDNAQARRLTNIERILGDAQQLDKLLAGRAATVDLAYARWVLCFVADPEAVIAGTARALKRGGRFVVQDYFNYESMTLAPRREPFSRVIAAVAKSFRTRGGDPDIMARIPALFRRHGLHLERLSVASRIATPDSMIWHWPDSFWKSYLPRLIELGHITADDAKAFEESWKQASSDPDTFMFLPPVFDAIAVKE